MTPNSSDEAEKTLDEIRSHFGGKVPEFLKALATVDESLLRSKWEDYKRTLFEESELLTLSVKSMMMYQVAKEYSQCETCMEKHEQIMQSIGISPELIKDLDENLSKSTLLDEKSKNILIFSHQALSKPTTQADENLLDAFKKLVGEREITEAVALISTCKSLHDFVHLLQLEKLEKLNSAQDNVP